MWTRNRGSRFLRWLLVWFVKSWWIFCILLFVFCNDEWFYITIVDVLMCTVSDCVIYDFGLDDLVFKIVVCSYMIFFLDELVVYGIFRDVIGVKRCTECRNEVYVIYINKFLVKRVMVCCIKIGF